MNQLSDNRADSKEKTKTPPFGRIFGVDPAGLAPAYPSGNNGMLLYTSRARIHEGNPSIEKAPFQGPFLYHSGLSVMLRNIPLLL